MTKNSAAYIFLHQSYVLQTFTKNSGLTFFGLGGGWPLSCCLVTASDLPCWAEAALEGRSLAFPDPGLWALQSACNTHNTLTFYLELLLLQLSIIIYLISQFFWKWIIKGCDAQLVEQTSHKPDVLWPSVTQPTASKHWSVLKLKLQNEN